MKTTYLSLLVACVVVPPARAQGVLDVAPVFTAPAYPLDFPTRLAVADLTGDALADLVATEPGESRLTVYVAQESGSYLRGLQLPFESATGRARIVDLDGDGNADVVADGDNDVDVALGLGGGKFGPVRSYPAGLSSRGVAVGDLDLDGALDAVSGNAWSLDLSVLLGRGDGTLRAPRSFPGSGSGILRLGDVDGDGRLDLADLAAAGATVYPGLPGGAFAPGTTYDAGSSPQDLELADLDLDGDLDLVTTDLGSATVGVRLGAGDGSFVGQTLLVAGAEPGDVEVADVNGDGWPDLAVGDLSLPGGVAVLSGLGGGVFAAPEVLFVGGTVQGLHLSDLEGDGDLDLVVHDSDHVTVVRATGPGTFQTPGIHRTGSGSESSGRLALADLNGDGATDLVSLPGMGFGPTNLSVLLGDGRGGFELFGRHRVGGGPQDVVCADVDGDGAFDLLVSVPMKSNVARLLGSGDGRFGPPREVVNDTVFSGRLEAADMDGDGAVDLALAGGSGAVVAVGIGDGFFETPLAFATVENTHGLAVGDVDLDGALDVAVTTWGSTSSQGFVEVFPGNGDGTLAPALAVPAGKRPGALAIGDLDLDGLPDLALSSFETFGESSAIFLYGNGDGTFPSSDVFPVELDFGMEAVAIADLDGNGAPDVAGVFDSRGEIGVWFGTPDGAFGLQRFAVGFLPSDLGVVDTDVDGALDLAAYVRGADDDEGFNHVTVLRNLASAGGSDG